MSPSYSRKCAHSPAQYAHVGGELSSLKAQVRTLENDMKDFKDIGKRYTDQLIKVKVCHAAPR